MKSRAAPGGPGAAPTDALISNLSRADVKEAVNDSAAGTPARCWRFRVSASFYFLMTLEGTGWWIYCQTASQSRGLLKSSLTLHQMLGFVALSFIHRLASSIIHRCMTLQTAHLLEYRGVRTLRHVFNYSAVSLRNHSSLKRFVNYKMKKMRDEVMGKMEAAIS